MVDMIEVFLDNQLSYCCCTCMQQVRVLSPSVQSRINRSRRQCFSGRDSCNPWVFQGHPLKLDRGNIGADCGNPLNFYWYIDCLFRDWGRVRSRYDWWCMKDCSLQELGDGLNYACFVSPIS